MKRFYKSKTVIASVVSGIAVLVFSLIFRNYSWLSGVLTDAGVTVLLFAPLVFFGYRIENRLSDVQESQAVTSLRQREIEERQDNIESDIVEAREEIRLTREQLSQAVVSKLAETRSRDSSLFSSVADNPTAENIQRALKRAKSLGLIADSGCRVNLFDTTLYVHFKPIDFDRDPPRTLHLTLEEMDGKLVARVPWRFDETALIVLTRIGEHVVRSGNYPGDIAFDSARIFSDLQELLEIAHARSTGANGLRDPLGKLVQLCLPQWAITDRSIVCVERSYSIPVSRLHEPDWDDHMRGKPWIDIGSFREAFDIAQGLYDSRLLALKPPEEPPF